MDGAIAQVSYILKANEWKPPKDDELSKLDLDVISVSPMHLHSRMMHRHDW